MNDSAIKVLVDIACRDRTPVQITLGKESNEWTADFAKNSDAMDIHKELIRRGYKVEHDPPGYYARLI